MQEICCIFVSIPPNLPIDQCNLTASHPTFPSGYCIFYGMVQNSYMYITLSHGITVECPTCHLYFLGIHTCLKCFISTILYLYFVYNKVIKNVFIFLLGLFHEVCYNTIVFLKTLKPSGAQKGITILQQK